MKLMTFLRNGLVSDLNFVRHGGAILIKYLENFRDSSIPHGVLNSQISKTKIPSCQDTTVL